MEKKSGTDKSPPPWKTKNPKKGKGKKGSTKLTEAQKDEARERAFKAGRPYPNLIDNMYVARKAKQLD